MPILSTNKYNFSPPRECESDDTAQQWLHPIFEIIASRNRSKEDLTSILRCLMTTIIGNLRISFTAHWKLEHSPSSQFIVANSLWKSTIFSEFFGFKDSNFKNLFYQNQGRAAWRKKLCDANASVCFDFIKAALPDNETVLLKFGNDGVNDTLLIYFSLIAHTNKNGRFQKNS